MSSSITSCHVIAAPILQLKPAFKKAYFEHLTKNVAFRNHPTIFSSRQWWRGTVRDALKYTGREYSDAEFDRFFRRVYQHYGSLDGYEVCGCSKAARAVHKDADE